MQHTAETDCPTISLTDEELTACKRLAATDRPLAPFAMVLLELVDAAPAGDRRP